MQQSQAHGGNALALPSDERTTLTRVRRIIIAYPLGVLTMSLALNALLGVETYAPSLPSPGVVAALVISAALLLLNHTWLMTATELVRLRFRLQTTPEQWEARGEDPKQASPRGVIELARHHGAHRNATENTTYFVLLSLLFVFGSPAALAAQLWLVSFGVARLGHAYGYLRGNDGVRGLFMTLTLLSLYGLASHLVWSLLLR